MDRQSTIVNDKEVPEELHKEENYNVYFREIKSENSDLQKGNISEDNLSDFRILLSEIESKAGGLHKLQTDLDLSSFQKRWIKRLLDNPEDETSAEDLAEHFSENMETRAKAKGKYVVVICTDGKLIVCHSYSGKKTMTVDTEIVNELLSPANIDKYATFEESDGNVLVKHYDKYDTKSFSNWLGIREEEVVFDIRGNVKIYTEVGELGCTFQFNRDEVLQKLIQSDSYEIKRDVLETPDGRYAIKKISWGQEHYKNGEKFKQELLMVENQVKHYKNKFQDIRENVENWMKDVIDKENDVIIRSKDEKVEKITKLESDFTPVFTSNRIQLCPNWRVKLANNFIGDKKNIPLFHCGGNFREHPFNIGNIRIYNSLDWSTSQQNFISSICSLIEQNGNGRYSYLLSFIVFSFAGAITKGEPSYLFIQLSDYFQERIKEEYSEGDTVIELENGKLGVEYKAKDWICAKGNSKIVKDIASEIDKGSKIIMVGIDEQNGREMDLIPSNRFESDRLNRIRKKLEETEDIEVEALSVPVDGNNLICFIEKNL